MILLSLLFPSQACAAGLLRWALTAWRQPGLERHQAQDSLFEDRINPPGRGIGHSGQIHAGMRLEDGMSQAHEAAGLLQRGTVWDGGNGGMSDERHGWPLS